VPHFVTAGDDGLVPPAIFLERHQELADIVLRRDTNGPEFLN